MAVLIQEPLEVNPETADWQKLINKLTTTTAGFMMAAISNFENNSRPEVLKGSRFEINRSYYEVNSQEAISGTPSPGLAFIYAVPNTGDGTASFQFLSELPTWDVAKGGWYSGTKRALWKLMYSSSTWANKAFLSGPKSSSPPLELTGGSSVWVVTSANALHTFDVEPGWYRYIIIGGGGGGGGGAGRSRHSGGIPSGAGGGGSSGVTKQDFFEIRRKTKISIISGVGGNGGVGGNTSDGNYSSSFRDNIIGGGGGGGGGGWRTSLIIGAHEIIANGGAGGGGGGCNYYDSRGVVYGGGGGSYGCDGGGGEGGIFLSNAANGINAPNGGNGGKGGGPYGKGTSGGVGEKNRDYAIVQRVAPGSGKPDVGSLNGGTLLSLFPTELAGGYGGLFINNIGGVDSTKFAPGGKVNKIDILYINKGSGTFGTWGGDGGKGFDNTAEGGKCNWGAAGSNGSSASKGGGGGGGSSVEGGRANGGSGGNGGSGYAQIFKYGDSTQALLYDKF